MTKKERIEELERRVKELEERQPMVVYPPVFIPTVWETPPPPVVPYKITFTAPGPSTCWLDALPAFVSQSISLPRDAQEIMAKHRLDLYES